MKYLVTGGAGFIGSHLVEGLVRSGHSVRVLDNLITGKRNNLAAVLSQIEFMEGDILNPQDLKKALHGVRVVFHEAALRSVPRSVEDPLSTNQVNITGTLQLLIACQEARVKRVIYASSSSVYGDNKIFPQSEALATAPLSPYAVSKLAAERYMVVFAKQFGVETVSLRYFNVFGPRQSPESAYAAVIPKFMQWAFNRETLQVHWNGRQSRDFTYVDNVVQANLMAAEIPNISGQIFNIACGGSNSLLDIVRILEKFTGRRLPRIHSPQRAGDIRKTWADIRKAKRLLGYKPRVGFEEGLRRTWEWFQSSAQVEGKS